jgi:protein tyrosine phosphatase
MILFKKFNLDDQNLLELQSVKNFYINASPMKVEITGRDYIFAQGNFKAI